MNRESGQPKWLKDGVALPLAAVSLTESDIDEAWVQDHLDRFPELVPITDIGPSWGPLVSLGRELPTMAGPVDNMFVSPGGDLTVVETKLWRNPEARRKVVGQLLDYAAALSRLSYEELDGIVREADIDRGGIWARVRASDHAVPDTEEAGFVDAIDRNLRSGAFLLLIVGDGIREDIEGIADLLRQHPGLRFHLALIELRLFRPPSTHDELVIVPSVVGRTREVTRAVVKIDRTHGGPDISIEVDEPDVTPRPRRLASLDDFAQQASEHMSDDTTAAIVSLAQWWQALGGRIRFNNRSINFAAPFAGTTAKLISVMSVYLHGSAEGSVAPLSQWRDALSPELTLERFRAAGFDGGADFPTRTIDPSLPDQEQLFKGLLRWAFDAVAELQTKPNHDATTIPAVAPAD